MAENNSVVLLASAASIEPLCHDNNPFDFVEGKILNLTLQYEAATS